MRYDRFCVFPFAMHSGLSRNLIFFSWFEDSSLNWLASESGSQKYLQCFACMVSGHMHQNKICFFLKNVKNDMKDVEYAESKEKSNLRFFRFLFLR